MYRFLKISLVCVVLSTALVFGAKELVHLDSVAHQCSGTAPLYIKGIAIHSGSHGISENERTLTVTAKALKENYKEWEGKYLLLNHNDRDVKFIVGIIVRTTYVYDKKADKGVVYFVAKVIDKEAQEKISAGIWKKISVGMENMKLKEEEEGIPPFMFNSLKEWTIIDFDGYEISIVTSPKDRDAKILQHSYNKYELF